MARLTNRQKHLLTFMMLYFHLMEALNAMLVFTMIVLLLKNRSRHRASGTHRTSSSNKRKRSEEGISEMVDQIRKWRDTCEVASRAIEKIAASFDKVEDRSQRLFAAIEDLGLLTPMQMIDVFEAMCKDQYKIDVFMGLPESLRRPYVLRILEEYNVYRPPFDPKTIKLMGL